MNYFFTEHKYAGSHGINFPKGYDGNGVNSIYNINQSNYNEIALDLKELTLRNSTTIKDFLAIPFGGSKYLMSVEAYNFLRPFSLPNHRAFPIELNHKGKVFSYKLVYFVFDIRDYLNYKRTSFKTLNDDRETIKNDIQSREQYFETMAQAKKSIAKEVAFRNSHKNSTKITLPEIEKHRKIGVYRCFYKDVVLETKVEKYDLIIDIGKIYSSPKLKNALNESTLTGLIIREKERLITTKDD